MDGQVPFVATDEHGLAERLRILADPPVVTGTDRPDPGTWLAESAAPLPPVVSTAGLAEIHALRPRDLTAEVGAGMRMSRLQEILEQEGLWIPTSGIGGARSVGGWVAAATPTPWDAAHGPVRRQLLGCRVVAPDGTRLAWGRAVMKNVAGYDLPRLLAGSRGRLGVITRVTLRLWPRPEAVSSWTIRGARGAAEFERIGIDALGWHWDPANGETLVAVLAGSASSVRRRESRLRHRAREQGAEIRETDARSLEAAGAGGEGARDDSIVYRLTPGRRYLPQVFHRLARCDGVRPERIDAMPGSGVMLVRFGASTAGSDGRDASSATVVGALEPVAGRARPMLGVERGQALVHAAVEALREPETKAVEAAIARALGAWPRVWQSDYL